MAILLQIGDRLLNQGGELFLEQAFRTQAKRKLIVEPQNRVVITSINVRGNPVRQMTKYKDESLDYMLDWTKYLKNSGNDTIIASEWVEDSGGITIDSDTNTTKKTVVWLSAGSNGNTYTVENTITTAAGRTAKRAIEIHVIELTTKNIGYDHGGNY